MLQHVLRCREKMWTIYILLFFCMLTGIGVVSAREPETLRVRHAFAKVPEVAVYLDLIGGDSQPVETP